MSNEEVEKYLNSLNVCEDYKLETDLETQTWHIIDYMNNDLKINLQNKEIEVQKAIKCLVIQYSKAILSKKKI